MPHQVGAAVTVALAAALAAALGGCAGSSATATATAGGTAVTEASFWPPPPNPPRVQFLRAFRLSSDVEREPSMLDKIVFGSAVLAIPIAKPYGLEMWRNRIYVCDVTNPAVVILDLERQQTRLMLSRGVEPMLQPTDIAIADDGRKYVADRRLGRIFVFDADDRHVTTFGEKGLVPAGVAVHGDELFVADLETSSILVLDRASGTRRRSVGGPGGGEGEFVSPVGVHVDAEGALYVSDAIRGRIQKFSAEGTLLRTFGDLGDAPGRFVRPKHITVDGDGNLYVVDAAFQNVQMFNSEGELLMFFGGPGAYPGSMSLPAGIAVHEAVAEALRPAIHGSFEATGLVLVSNQFGGNKVSVYALGHLREGSTVQDLAPPVASAPAPPPGGAAADRR